MNPVRRRLVLGLAALPLAGCDWPLVRDRPPVEAPPVRAANRLRVVVFELYRLNLPVHVGVILTQAGETLIYDPSGIWRGGQRVRESEVIRPVTPQIEADYLSRAGIRYAPGGWAVHEFDTALTPQVARLAQQRIEAAPRMPPLHCAYAVSTLLAGLPGFDDVQQSRIPAALFRSLRDHPGLRHHQRVII